MLIRNVLLERRSNDGAADGWGWGQGGKQLAMGWCSRAMQRGRSAFRAHITGRDRSHYYEGSLKLLLWEHVIK